MCVFFIELFLSVTGSPFQFTVGPLRDHGSHLVKAGGAGLERGEQGELCEFNVWTREAGSGQLAISVEGPSKAEIKFTDRKDGSCDVAYKVSEQGELVPRAGYPKTLFSLSPAKLDKLSVLDLVLARAASV